MPIYEKATKFLMQDMAEEFALLPGQSFSRDEVMDWFESNYPKIKKGTLTANLIRLSVNAPSRFHHSPKPGEDDVFFQIDSGHFRLYDPANDPTPIYTATDPTPEPPDNKQAATGSEEFAYERDLQNYLVKNLHLIKPGLKLYEDDEIRGIEFPAGGRFIDILAVDSDGALVVIELKVSRGYDRVVGQLMRYMAWIAKNQAEEGQKVRGIIIAREISEDLVMACSLLPNAQLFEYQLSLSLRQIDP